MKSKDLRNVVLSKYESGDGPTKIFRDLNGALGLRTIKRWCKVIQETGSCDPLHALGRPRIVRTKEIIEKVKNRVKRKKQVSVRVLARDLDISKTSIHRILKNDLRLRPYKRILQPLLTDKHKEKRKKFSNWVRNNYRKEDTMRILFSDEKWFDIDGIYNSHNDRVWAVDRAEADKKGGIKQKRKFPQKVMVWLGVCSN